MNGLLYIEEQAYGEVKLPLHRLNLRCNIAPIYGCPQCGEVWARFVPRPEVPALYMFYTKECRDHGEGSLRLYGGYPLDSLPLAALSRELELILKEEKVSALPPVPGEGE